MTKILLIDNYDSFTYNVSQALASLREGIEVEVIRNDQISVQEVKQRIQQDVYDAIVISPGSGCPADAGITLDLIRELGARRETEGDTWAGTPILGVCLGHQAIGEVLVNKWCVLLSQFMASLHRSIIRAKEFLLGCLARFKQPDTIL